MKKGEERFASGTENPEGVMRPQAGGGVSVANETPASRATNPRSAEGTTDPRQGMERSGSGLCPPNPSCGVRIPDRRYDSPQNLSRRGYTPAWNLSPLRGFPFHTVGVQGFRASRSIPCLGYVTPSGFPFSHRGGAGIPRFALHTLPGICHPFGVLSLLKGDAFSVIMVNRRFCGRCRY